MRQLKPWAYGPFEILMHAEMHYLSGEDLDRRISMIGFDNAIELAITTYLNLHPYNVGGKSTRKKMSRSGKKLPFPKLSSSSLSVRNATLRRLRKRMK